MLEGLTYDDNDFPPIGVVASGTSWKDVVDHIKIAHDFLVIPPDGDGSWSGAYWTGTEMTVMQDLGPDQDEAVENLREELRGRGEL